MSGMRKVADVLRDAVEASGEIVHEMDRLYGIETRVRGELNEVQEQISGLEKASGFSSISHEARKVLEITLGNKKIQANHLGYLLGMGEVYKIERR